MEENEHERIATAFERIECFFTDAKDAKVLEYLKHISSCDVQGCGCSNMYVVNRIATAFERIEDCFFTDAKDAKVLEYLKHISSCDVQGCCCSTMRRNVNLELLNSFPEFPQCVSRKPDIIPLLVSHSLHCTNPQCRIDYCNDTRKELQDHCVHHSAVAGTVVLSNTEWFDVGEHVHISRDYLVLCKKHLGSGTFGTVYYEWLLKGCCDAAVANKRTSDYESDMYIGNIGEHLNVLTSQLIMETVSDTEWCMFMEKAECTLLEYVNSYHYHYPSMELHLSMKPQVAFVFIKQLLNALDFLHENNIIHGDIKGDNIVLSHNMQNLKLIDFNSCLLRGKLRNLKSHFTYGYKPPETFQDEIEVLPSLDIYSFGVVVLEMFFLAMEVQLNRLTMGSIQRRNNDNIAVLRQPQHYPALASFVQLCVHVDPLKRPQSAKLASEMIKEDVDDLKMYWEQATIVPPIPIKYSQTNEHFLVKRMVSYMDKHLEKRLPRKRTEHDPEAVTLMDCERILETTT